MATGSPLVYLTISRRTAIGMALTAATLSGRLAMPRGGFAADENSGSGTWNWRGNAGHTWELPGPGLDFNGPLGELWRVPGGHDSLFVAYVDDIYYAIQRDGGSSWAVSISAMSGKDGTSLWTRTASSALATPTAAGTPQTDVEEVYFSTRIAISNGIVLVGLTNGHLWALDAITGEVRWDVDLGSPNVDNATVVDDVVYLELSDGVAAVELGDSPRILWQMDFGERSPWLLGVDGGLVYVSNENDAGQAEIRALTSAEGSEFWRTSPNELVVLKGYHGISQGRLFLQTVDYQTGEEYLTVLDQEGQVLWRAYDEQYVSGQKRVMNGMITRIAPSGGVTGGIRFASLFVENGQPSSNFDIYDDRWDYSTAFSPVLCDGWVYVLVYDTYEYRYLLLAVDPSTGEIHGAGVRALPLIVSGGKMLATDFETGEIVAIGAVDAILQPGGRARVTTGTALRGAPGNSALERDELPEETVVVVTGERETSADGEWFPVIVQETEDSGWIRADALEGLDGQIAFSPIGIGEFGEYESYPKFGAGTKAVITEKIAMRGAPSESSAKKSTLEPGTLVTVTSAPTTKDDVDWCPITVDETGDNGWVPTTVLELVSLSMEHRENSAGIRTAATSSQG